MSSVYLFDLAWQFISTAVGSAPRIQVGSVRTAFAGQLVVAAKLELVAGWS